MPNKRRYVRESWNKAAATISFRVPTIVKATIESSTADKPSEFWRAAAAKISEAIENGATAETILASLDNYQAITTGAQNDAKP